MEGLGLLFSGFDNSLTTVNLVACFIGALIGTLVGVLPGLGPTATMVLMLPFTLPYGPTTGLIMMTGVWYGAMYGGSTTSILVNIPGEAASVVTCIDGYQMCKKGRAGAALALVAIGSFVAGTIGLLGLQFFAPVLGNAALSFGPPEFLCFMILAFVLLSNLSAEAPLKGALMIALGLFLSTIGITPMDSYPRFTFGSEKLMLGIDFVPIAVGLFGISEILNTAIEKYVKPVVRKVRLKELYPDRDEIRRSVGPMLRGSTLGFFVGLLPGPCTVISTFVAYAFEKRISKTPERFGHGAVEGVVAPESANNSAVMGSMIPLLTLGIPFAAPSAIMLAGLRMHNVEPGPMLFVTNPDVFWTFIAAMYIGNLMLLILNLPLIPLWVRVLKIPYSYLSTFIILFCLIGAYSLNNSTTDIYIAVVFSIVGLLLKKFAFEPAPLVLAFVLGPLLETALRRSLILSDGSLLIFLQRPISAGFILFAVVVLVAPLFSHIRLGRGLSEED